MAMEILLLEMNCSMDDYLEMTMVAWKHEWRPAVESRGYSVLSLGDCAAVRRRHNGTIPALCQSAKRDFTRRKGADDASAARLRGHRDQPGSVRNRNGRDGAVESASRRSNRRSRCASRSLPR